MIIALADAVSMTCGGKAGALGALVRAGVPVPDGFVLPYRAVQRAVPAREGLHEALGDGLELLGDGPVAVRSSASNEDTEASSAAGRYVSILGVRGVDRVATAVRACWASLGSPCALDHPTGVGPTDDTAQMAVLVQRLVDADVSGVMFTPAAQGDPTRVEAAWGLGPSVVGGTVTPDSYRIDRRGAITRRLADKRTRVDRHGGRLVRSEVSTGGRNSPTLDGATARRLADLGDRVADVLGAAQDIEWAFADDRLWILQARPITATLPAAAVPSVPVAGGLMSGTPGSHGTVSGPARVIRGPGDFARVRPGDILVCPYTDPAWTPLLRTVAGVVTETGGVLSHAAIIARECRIPAVLGVGDATSRLRDGTMITIDGRHGTVATHD